MVLLDGCALPPPPPNTIEPLPVSLARHPGTLSLNALLRGPLVVSQGCIFLAFDEHLVGVSWPSDTHWDPIARILTSGGVQARLGQRVMLTGGRFDLTPENIGQGIWIDPPLPKCLGDSFWRVGLMELDTLSSPTPP